MPCSKVILLFYMSNHFLHIPTSEGGIPTSEWVILTKQAGGATKQGDLREFKTLFCAYAHAQPRKTTDFDNKLTCFDAFCDICSYPTLYTRRQECETGKARGSFSLSLGSSSRCRVPVFSKSRGRGFRRRIRCGSCRFCIWISGRGCRRSSGACR